MMPKKDREMIVDLICKEQARMISENADNYKSDKYKELEKLKNRIKSM